MNEKELTKSFVMISNRKKRFGLQGFHKKFSALRIKQEQISVARAKVFISDIFTWIDFIQNTSDDTWHIHVYKYFFPIHS